MWFTNKIKPNKPKQTNKQKEEEAEAENETNSKWHKCFSPNAYILQCYDEMT